MGNKVVFKKHYEIAVSVKGNIMKKWKKLFRCIGIGCIIITLLATASIWLLFSDSSPINRTAALRTTQEWARLAPYPEFTNRVQVEINGGFFTREFVIEFNASPSDIEDWLMASPGTKDLEPTKNADGSLHYEIEPGGGAQFAELILSNNGGTVRVKVFWS